MFVHRHINTNVCTEREKQKGKTRDRVKASYFVILKTINNLLVAFMGINHILFFLINELNE